MQKIYAKRSLLFFVLALSCLIEVSAQTTVSLPLLSVGKINDAGLTGTDLSGISTATGQYRGWMKFDLSVIPSGATITGATLSYPTIAGTVNSTSTACQLNALSFDPASAAWSALISPNVGVANIFTGAWAGTHPLALSTAGAPGGSAAATTALINYLQSNVGNLAASFSLIRGSTNIYNFSTSPTLSVTYVPGTACAGAPSAGNTLASSNSICPSVPVNLSLSNSFIGIMDLQFQWQSSPDSSTWSDIGSATQTSYSTTITANTYFRCVVTCNNSLLSDTSVGKLVTLNGFLDCYCSSSANNTADEEIFNVTVNGFSTDPLYSNANGCTTVAPGPNSILSRYSNFSTLGALTSINRGVTIPFSILQDECDGATYFSNGVAIWIDFNQNGQFTDPGEKVFVETVTTAGPRTITGSFLVPMGASLGNTMMRVVCAEGLSGTGLVPCGTYGYGETEDYLVNILAAPICNNPPTAGVVTGVDSVCPSTSTLLTLTGYSLGTDLQWQTSLDGQIWSDVPGAVNPSYTTPLLTDTAYYRVRVNCIDTVYSDTLMIGIKSFLNCYCSSSATNTADEEIFSVTVNGSSTNALYAGTNGCNTAAPGPNSVLSRYSNFKTLGPLTTLYQGAITPFSVVQDECDGATYFSNGIAIWIDFNQNGQFTDPGENVFVENATATGPRTIGGNFAIPANTTIGSTVMRVICAEGFSGTGLTPCLSYGYGETEDYIVDIQAAPACTNPPVAGIATGPDTAGVGPASEYILSGYTGSNIQWQFATDTLGPWSDIANTNNDTIALFFNSPGVYYLRAIVFETGCDNDTSNFVASVLLFRGDDVCDAQPLSFGVNGPFTTTPATIQVGEPAPPANGCQVQDGWCNNTITNTLWFTFVAPASGRVSLQSPDFDTQIAIWDADNCDTILTGGATLLYANDDDGNNGLHNGALFSSFIDSAICLTPGRTYYVQLDAYSAPGGFTEVILTDLGPGPDASFTNLNPSYCPDASPVALTAGTSGGSYFGIGLTQDTIFDPSLAATQVAPGTPIVIYYQLWACYQTTDTLVIDTLPVATLNGQTNVSCNGGSNGAIDVNTSGASPFVFSWSNSATTEDVSGLSAGSYTLTVTDSKSCSGILGPLTITEPSPFMVMLDSVKNVKCNGDASGAVYVSTMGGTMPYSYDWSNADTTETLTAVVADTYNLTASDALGCSSTLSASVSEPVAIVITVDSIMNNACAGQSNGAIYITPSNGNSPYSFLWSNTETTEDITGLSAGMYDVSVLDAIGCAATLDTVVTAPLPIAIAVDTVISPSCFGSTNGEVQITVSGGTPGYSYAWSNNATTEDLTALGAGNYIGTITDAASCSVTASVAVTAPDAVVITVDSVKNVKCFGNTTGGVYVSLAGGNGGFVFSWSNAATTEDIAGLAQGTYTLTATDSKGCSATSSSTVTQPASALSATSVSTDQVQGGANGSVNLTATGGTLPYSYLWSNGATTEDLTSVAAGIFTCTITDANGCTKVQSDTVGVIIGINDPVTAFELNLFPNPATTQITVTVKTTEAQDVNVVIMNVSGQMIAEKNVERITSSSMLFDMSNQAEGVYFARINVGASTTVRKFIVNR